MADPAEGLGFGRTPPHDYDLRPGPGPRRAPGFRVLAGALTALGALAVGFLMASGMSAGREEAQAQIERKDELIALITERQDHADELAEELDDLRGQVEVAQAEAAVGVPALQEEVENIELVAGLVDLRGPGVRLTLSDAPSSCPSTPYACRIQDSDVQLAVNALFEAGAEAVAVGGERVMATTSIRSVGQTVLVNLTVLSSPYEIEAVGDPETLREEFGGTAFAEDFEGWVEEFGLGMDVSEVEEVEVPRYNGTLGMNARPSGDGTATGR